MSQAHTTKVQVFEISVALLKQHNLYQRSGRVPMDTNSRYVVDDAKQWDKMAAAFYRTVQAEIEEYKELADELRLKARGLYYQKKAA